MTNLYYSLHARTRMQQRGVRCGDVELILSCATQIDDDVFLLRDKDADHEIEKRQQEIRALERLRNQKVVLAGNVVRTTYSSTRNDQKRMLRRGRQKAAQMK